jgi:hypothetical protein
MAVVLMLIMTIIVIGLTTATTSNVTAFGRDHATNRALNYSESGLNAGVSAVKALPVSASSLPSVSGTTDGSAGGRGAWQYGATRALDHTDANTDYYDWTVTATGVSPDGRRTRIVSQKVREAVTHHTSSQVVHHGADPAYGYGFFLGDSSSDCATLSGTGNNFGGNLTISVNIYVAGSLCLSGNQQIVEPAGAPAGGQVNLYVGKTLKLQGNNTSVGTSTTKIHAATIVGGCVRGSAVTCSVSSSSHVYANAYYSTQNPLSKPPIDTSWYANSRPGPTTGCNDDPTHPGNAAYQSVYPSGYTAATFKSALFDNDSTLNASRGNVDFFQFGSFDCRYYDSGGNLIGRLKWQTGSPGTLTILGTIWIDGNLAFANDTANVQGRGTIYATGTITFSGGSGTKICETPTSGAACLGNYDATQNLLVLVAYNGGSHTGRAFQLTGQSTFEGVVFTNGEAYEAGQATLHGPIIADTATMAGNGDTRSNIDPPPGAPGAAYDETITQSSPDTVSWSDVPGSWRQCTSTQQCG